MTESELDFLLIICPEQQTFMRLIRMAKACDAHPVALAIAILHDVLEDDECSHIPNQSEPIRLN